MEPKKFITFLNAYQKEHFEGGRHSSDYKKFYLEIMEVIKNSDLRGWFVGNFEPNLIKRDDIEVGIKEISKGTMPDYHFHKKRLNILS